MPTAKEWKKVHAELMAKLHLPCKLRFTDKHKVGAHDWNYRLSGCWIAVNLEADFRVPEHLILHEAAHHRVIEPLVQEDREGESDLYYHDCTHRWSAGHCKHWAETLCGLYVETGIALPYSTGFKNFADAADIKFKLFDPSADNQMIAVMANPQLVEGA